MKDFRKQMKEIETMLEKYSKKKEKNLTEYAI